MKINLMVSTTIAISYIWWLLLIQKKTLVKALLNHIRKQSVKPEGKTNPLLEFNMLKKYGTGYLKDI